LNDNKFEINCSDCGKKVRSRRVNFCPACGRELYAPKIEKSWNYKVLGIIFILLLILYSLYLIFKPVIYFNLDKV